MFCWIIRNFSNSNYIPKKKLYTVLHLITPGNHFWNDEPLLGKKFYFSIKKSAVYIELPPPKKNLELATRFLA